MTSIRQWCKELLLSFLASILFYTAIPLPYLGKLNQELDFQKVAQFAPGIGLVIGGILALLDLLLAWLGIPILTRSVSLVCIWLALTGGLHLDGAMDTADGLAVGNPERRLAVMADSTTGAFGAMVAVAIFLLKAAGLTDIEDYRWFVLIAAGGWGRWGQVLAIAKYPYLKPTGKGAFHKQAIRSYKDVLPGLLLMIGWSLLPLIINPNTLVLSIVTLIGGIAIAFVTGFWFHRKLGGHTGDTYGAVVEWTEALLLCVITAVL
ncbi:adenosylcobinamide-GDP ribazoletransferase [Calothrix sp. UHCC 0171]|uniref:adenosylcobinamide-GDP ribazoletransferase n=1 Tax=Calothrix sp. UHCC 0171 TaxID=3110245 RepID=UPI002B205197|nr:adenosylcobinamide-GDP ribazoletransferase [Calothrix sp. UHCC 0171]MEA5572354.1 adenosylcobinamide-GDP ribazoletransferase [Calothrix sp. UHCC 0171]